MVVACGERHCAFLQSIGSQRSVFCGLIINVLFNASFDFHFTHLSQCLQPGFQTSAYAAANDAAAAAAAAHDDGNGMMMGNPKMGGGMMGNGMMMGNPMMGGMMGTMGNPGMAGAMNPMMGGGMNPMMQNFPLMGMDEQKIFNMMMSFLSRIIIYIIFYY